MVRKNIVWSVHLLQYTINDILVYKLCCCISVLQGINGILADEMGLGKTVQSIAFLSYLAEVSFFCDDYGSVLLIGQIAKSLKKASGFWKWGVPLYSESRIVLILQCSSKQVLNLFVFTLQSEQLLCYSNNETPKFKKCNSNCVCCGHLNYK